MDLKTLKTPAFYVLQSPFTVRQKDISVTEIELRIDKETKAIEIKNAIIKKQVALFFEVIQEDIDSGLLTILDPAQQLRYYLEELERNERGESRRIGVFAMPDGSNVLIALTDKGVELAGDHGMEPYTLLGMRVMSRLAESIEASGEISTTLKTKMLGEGGASFSLFQQLIVKDENESDGEPE